MRNVLLVINGILWPVLHLQNDNNFCNFWLGQISRFILSHYVSCLKWLTCLFLFIMVKFVKVSVQPDLKMVLIFLVRKSSKRVQCLNEFMFHSHVRFYICLAIVSDKVIWWPECVQPPPLLRKNRPLGSPVKITFRQFLLYLWYWRSGNFPFYFLWV